MGSGSVCKGNVKAYCGTRLIYIRKQERNSFEWSDIKQDLKSLQGVAIEDNGRSLAVRTECLGTCGKVFQSAGVAIPPAIRER